MSQTPKLDFTLSDFMNYYVQSNADTSMYSRPPAYNVSFYDSINMKREFSTCKPKAIDLKPPPGEQLPHQRFIARYMSPHTPYDRLLLFHGLGTGKTCLASAVVELARNIMMKQYIEPKVAYLVVPKRLIKTLRSEIAEICTCLERSEESVYTTSTGKLRRHTAKCLRGKYVPDATDLEQQEQEDIDSRGGAKKSSHEVRESIIGRKIRKAYRIMTYLEMAKFVEQTKAQGTFEDTFRNTYVIMDEVHNLKEADDDKRIDKYKLIWELTHKSVGTKFLFMTATPMRDQAQGEIVNLFNLILPEDKQLKSEDVAFDNESNQLKNPSILQQAVKGYVSYLRSMVSNVQIVYEGQIIPPLQHTHVYPLTMHTFQSDVYKKAYESNVKQGGKKNNPESEEENEAVNNMWLQTIHANSFVFPDGSFGPAGQAKYIHVYDRSGKQISLAGSSGGKASSAKTSTPEESELDIALTLEEPTDVEEDVDEKKAVEQHGRIEISEEFKAFLEQDGTSIHHRLHRLSQCSAKFAFTIEQIIKYPRQKMFVYSRFVQGGGVLLFAALLSYFGYGLCTGSETSDAKRFMLATPLISTATQTQHALTLFNSKQNVYGNMCQVVIGSPVVGEGFSFKAIRKTFIMTPFWNDGSTDQAIGRSIRSFSHDDLPLADRTVQIYKLCDLVTDEDIKSIDLIMYQTCEDKDYRIKQVERILKESAIDCVLNRARNISPFDQDGTKACDYSACDYKCSYVDSLASTPALAGVITDTNNLFYADEEIRLVMESVKKLFSQKSSYDFEELFQMLFSGLQLTHPDVKLNSIVLSRALHEMVSGNVRVLNRLGFFNYLRSDRNMYFLVDDPLAGRMFWNVNYANHPTPYFINKEFETTWATTLASAPSNYERVVKAIAVHANNPTKVRNVLNNMFPMIFDEMLKNSVKTMFVDQNDNNVVARAIFNIYKDQVEVVDDAFVVVSVDKNNPIVCSLEELREVTHGALAPWSSSGEVLEEWKEEQGQRKHLIINNPLHWYGIWNQKDQTFKIKHVIPVRGKMKTQVYEPDNRVVRTEEGINCTASFSKSKLYMLCDIIQKIPMLMKAFEHDPAMLRQIPALPPFVAQGTTFKPETLPVIIPQTGYTAQQIRAMLQSIKSNKNVKSELRDIYWTNKITQLLLQQDIKSLHALVESMLKEISDEKVVEKALGGWKTMSKEMLVPFLLTIEEIMAVLKKRYGVQLIGSTTPDQQVDIVMEQLTFLDMNTLQFTNPYGPIGLAGLYAVCLVDAENMQTFCNVVKQWYKAHHLLLEVSAKAKAPKEPKVKEPTEPKAKGGRKKKQ
jgi:hypothetical protein